MGRLDELDLSVKLERSEQDERLERGGRRLAQLRLALGGKLDGDGRLGPQLRRFERRQADPLKRWKITEEDWRNRQKRPQHVEAAEEMLARTDVVEAPWILVEAESKRFGRVKVMESVIEQIERGCAARGFALPQPLEPETAL